MDSGEIFTSIDYDWAYQVQQGRCKICKRHQSDIGKRFHVDHDHKTGKFRALLCFNCNKQLGVVENFREKAEVYLEEFHASQIQECI